MSEYAEVLIPPSPGERGDGNGKVYRIQTHKCKSCACHSFSHSLKFLTITVLFFTVIMAVITGVFIVRYESKISNYEYRVTELEADLDTFFQVLAEEIGYEHEHDEKRGEEDDWKILAEELVDHQKQPGEEKLRRKRQIQFPLVPTYGPEVERTDDGVPILDQSYQLRAASGQRFDYNLPVAHATAPPPPTPDSTGLRLYENLVVAGDRKQPTSEDFGSNGEQLPGLLPHHKVSAAWSEKNSLPNRRVQLRSGDLGLFDDHYGGPRFAQQMTYTKSTDRGRRVRPQRPSPTPIPTSSTRLASVGSSGTFHRNSRVAATSTGGGAAGARDKQAYSYRRRVGVERRDRDQMEYAPLRRMSLGDGQGDVIARVVQDDDNYPYGSRKMGNLRRDRERSQQYFQGRPEVRRRPPPTSTENPQGYSWGQGSLNVTINKSTPFQTYYSNSHRNWDAGRSRTFQSSY